MKIAVTGDFDRMYRALVAGNDSLKTQVADRITLFKKNPNDTRLSNHRLRRRLRDKWAFSVTDDIRIVYIKAGKQSIRFLAIGIHATVYKKN